MTTRKRRRPRASAYRDYTPELLAHIRRRYEDTAEPAVTIATDLGIHHFSLHRLAKREGWVRRVHRAPRDLSPALRLLEEAKAMAEGGDAAIVEDAAVVLDGAASLPPPERGRSPSAARRVGLAEPTGVTPSRTASQSDLPLSGGGMAAPPPEPSTIERLERAALAELATIEAMRAALGRVPQRPIDAERTVRTLGLLTQILQQLQRLRVGSAAHAKTNSGTNDHDDDMSADLPDDWPRDIDEFRRELARRIDAFVASRTGAGGAGGNVRAGTLDQTR
jgi:hypothetical protein